MAAALRQMVEIPVLPRVDRLAASGAEDDLAADPLLPGSTLLLMLPAVLDRAARIAVHHESANASAGFSLSIDTAIANATAASIFAPVFGFTSRHISPTGRGAAAKTWRDKS